MRDDDADARRNPGEIAHAVKQVGNDGEAIVRDDGSLVFVKECYGAAVATGSSHSASARRSLQLCPRFNKPLLLADKRTSGCPSIDAQA